MKLKSTLLSFAATCFLVTASHAATISVNFVGGQDGNGGGGGAAPVTTTAGDVAVGNWNNAGPAAGTLVNVIDDGGAGTGADVTWSVGNTWSATGTAPGGGGDADMMSGYLDNFGGQTITVSNVPYSLYEVRVYHNLDSAGVMGFAVNGGTALFSQQQGAGGSNFPLGGGSGFVGSTSTSNGDSGTSTNFTLFTGLTGSTLTIAGVNGGFGDARSRPNGFQITQVPEPSSMLLVGLGSLGLVLRRRR